MRSGIFFRRSPPPFLPTISAQNGCSLGRPVVMSAQEYRAKAELLVMRANTSTEEAAALELIGLAAE